MKNITMKNMMMKLKMKKHNNKSKQYFIYIYF